MDLSSTIVVKPHEAGVLIDFPLPEPASERGRRQAWRTFEVGILMLVGTLIGFVGFQAGWPRGPIGVLILPFLAGLACLVSAASQSWSAWEDETSDADVSQLSVAGNLLIRTRRDLRKEIWYRDEVGAIVVTRTSIGLNLVVELHKGERAVLASQSAASPAELEQIATELWRALRDNADSLAHAIEATNPRTPETRITES